MADLNRIPVRYFEKTDAYGFVVDNRPLKDLNRRIEAVNGDISSIQQALNIASGDLHSVAERLGVSIELDGTIKSDAVPEHSLENHSVDGNHVLMTDEERIKLQTISNSATNFSLRINSGSALRDKIINLEDSASIKLFETSGGLQFYSPIPTNYYHIHHGPIEPLVKCAKEDGEYVWDEDASPAYYISAITTYRANEEGDRPYPDYFYTSDGVPSGENDGTPVPFRMGSLNSTVNGIGIPLEYVAKDAELGRFQLSSNISWNPKYINAEDFDLFNILFEETFSKEDSVQNPSSSANWYNMRFTSSDVTTLTVRSSSPTTFAAFKLNSVNLPVSGKTQWTQPDSWLDDYQKLSYPNAMVFDNLGGLLSWNSSNDPATGQGGWFILRKSTSQGYVYYLVWSYGSTPNYPLNVTYQATEALPTTAPMWSFESFSSGEEEVKTVRSSGETTVVSFPLDRVPTGRLKDWATPDSWLSTFEVLSIPNGLTTILNGSSRSVIPWDTSSDPEKGDGGWILFRENIGSSYEYHLGWLDSSLPDYPLEIFYQCNDY